MPRFGDLATYRQARTQRSVSRKRGQYRPSLSCRRLGEAQSNNPLASPALRIFPAALRSASRPWLPCAIASHGAKTATSKLGPQIRAETVFRRFVYGRAGPTSGINLFRRHETRRRPIGDPFSSIPTAREETRRPSALRLSIEERIDESTQV